MKKLNFLYEVGYSFSHPVTEHCYALRILPETNEEQGIYASEYSISGGGSACKGRDGFGNLLLSGRIAGPHDRFGFRVLGTAYTHRGGGKPGEAHPIYRYATELTAPGRDLSALFAARREEMNGSAEAWMHLASQSLIYEPGQTDIHTTAEAALAGGRGVCQDYAHILLALLRMDRIPARYVAGFMLGEGATHAWVEAYIGGRWIGLDPTHDRVLTDDYIEVARGRDYRDSIMDRGNFRGFATQEMQVRVKVSEYEPVTVEPFGIL